MNQVLVINGPNLNRLGEREPEIYGSVTLDALNQRLAAEASLLGFGLTSFQSNHEGEIIDRIQRAPEEADAVILNPGGLTHTSVSLRDAVEACPLPVIEVHLSNLFAREEFRRRDLVAPVCAGVIMGLGADGYVAALRVLQLRLAPSRIPE